jgi:hypothetical protein
MDSSADAKPGDGLRELADLIVRDNVCGSSVPDYLQFLIEEQLIELDAQARRWARTVPVLFCDSTSSDLALALRRRATELDDVQNRE